MKRRIDVRKRLKESFDKDRYEKISGKTVNDVDGFSTDYTLYFDHDENNYFTVFGDNELYGPDSEHDWDFGSNEDEAWEWFDDYEGFNQDDDWDDAAWHDTADQEQTDQPDYIPELADDDLQAGQWYESLNKKSTSKKSCNEGLLFRDNGAGLADKGYLFTLQELGKIYDDCIKAKDPVVMEYKNFSDWMNDTVNSGLLEIVDERAFDESCGKNLKESDDDDWDPDRIDVLWEKGRESIIEDIWGYGISDGWTVNRFFITEEGKPLFDYQPSKQARAAVDKLIKSGELVHEANESINEDTVKQGNAWVNKGKEGTHGKFKTKKAADAQRRVMFAQGFETKRK